MVSTHGPVRLAGAGRSTVAVGHDGIAVLRNPYDLGQLAERFVAVLVIGGLTAAVANSLLPGHLDTITLVFGVVLLLAILPVVICGIAAVVGAAIGTAAAIARPRQTLRAMKTVWRGVRTDNVSDFVAARDASAVRMVVARDEIRDITPVRGWLRPHLEIAQRSGQVHRISAHPWWRLQLTGLARDLRELCTAGDG